MPKLKEKKTYVDNVVKYRIPIRGLPSQTQGNPTPTASNLNPKTQKLKEKKNM